MPGFAFLDLPGEIRNAIYFQLLVLPSLSVPKHLQHTTLHTSILHTCRKIHHEAEQILYGCNTFIAHPNILTGMPRLRVCFGAFGSSNLISLIRRYHIHLRLDCDANFTAAKAKEAFTGMEELTVEVSQAQYGSSDYKMLKLFERVRGVKKAQIIGSITSFPEYASWLQETMMIPEGIEILELGHGEDKTKPVGPYDMWIVSCVVS